jgi:hypothetical protein
MTTTHKCPIADCQVEVVWARLMCATHWRLVPRRLRGPVYRAWHHGRGYATEAHQQACEAAIEAVETILGRPRRPAQPATQPQPTEPGP